MDSEHLQVDLERLFKLRLVVARHGEMDVAKWWNTQGLLGRRGKAVLRRGFPATHSFAQARVVFAVARSRCRELFDPPGSMTLWQLPAELEDQFEERWHDWLDEGDRWAPFFDAVEGQGEGSLLEALKAQDLLTPAQAEAAQKLKRSAEGRAVALGEAAAPTDEVITMLAAAFARGEVGSPAIPYAKLEG